MKKGIFSVFLVVFIGLFFSPALWAEVGITDTEIILGSQQDLSGPIVAFGVTMKNGLVMRAREINEKGGIHGRQIKLLIEDNGYDPKKAVMLANKQINRDKIFSFISVLGTPTSLACFPIATRKKIPFLFPTTLSEKFHTPFNRYSFIAYASYVVQGRNIAKYFVETKKYKKIGLLYQDNDQGIEVLKGVKEQLATYDMKPSAAEPFKRGATTFSSQIAKLRKADVQVIVLAGVIREPVAALKEIHTIGWKVDLCCTSASMSHYVPILAKKSGISADGMYVMSSYPDPLTTKEPFLKAWAQRYKEWFGKPSTLTAYPGYDSVHWFGIAAERAGRNLTRENLIDALETFRNVETPLGGPPVTFTNKSHLGSKYYFMARVKGMMYERISDWISYEE